MKKNKIKRNPLFKKERFHVVSDFPGINTGKYNTSLVWESHIKCTLNRESVVWPCLHGVHIHALSTALSALQPFVSIRPKEITLTVILVIKAEQQHVVCAMCAMGELHFFLSLLPRAGAVMIRGSCCHLTFGNDQIRRWSWADKFQRGRRAGRIVLSNLKMTCQKWHKGGKRFNKKGK